MRELPKRKGGDSKISISCFRTPLVFQLVLCITALVNGKSSWFGDDVDNNPFHRHDSGNKCNALCSVQNHFH